MHGHGKTIDQMYYNKTFDHLQKDTEDNSRQTFSQGFMIQNLNSIGHKRPPSVVMGA